MAHSRLVSSVGEVVAAAVVPFTSTHLTGPGHVLLRGTLREHHKTTSSRAGEYAKPAGEWIWCLYLLNTRWDSGLELGV